MKGASLLKERLHFTEPTLQDEIRKVLVLIGTAAGITEYGGITRGNARGYRACTETTVVCGAELDFVRTAEITNDPCVCKWHRCL